MQREQTFTHKYCYYGNPLESQDRRQFMLAISERALQCHIDIGKYVVVTHRLCLTDLATAVYFDIPFALKAKKIGKNLVEIWSNPKPNEQKRSRSAPTINKKSSHGDSKTFEDRYTNDRRLCNALGPHHGSYFKESNTRRQKLNRLPQGMSEVGSREGRWSKDEMICFLHFLLHQKSRSNSSNQFFV